MVVQVRFQIRHRGCFTERLAGDTQMIHLGADEMAGVSVLRTGSPEELEAALEIVRASQPEVSVLERRATDAILRCRRCAGGVIATLQGFGCTILWPVRYADGLETYQVLVPTRDRLAAVVERLREMGDVNLLRVTESAPETLGVSVALSDVTDGFTERQLAILRHALAAGYYDSPRRVNIADLAVSFGISRSTMEEHLRKAERRVMEGFGTLLADNAALVKVAKARRPPAPTLQRPVAKPHPARVAVDEA